MAIIDEKSWVLYDVIPKIIQAGKVSAIQIKPIALVPFGDQTEYLLRVTGMETRDVSEYRIKPEQGRLVFSHAFRFEQEYTVQIGKCIGENEAEWFSVVYLYSLGEDLFNIRPYKGDFHMHSQRSDGRESPAGVCAFSRKFGLDFVAVTDHKLYMPSIEAIKAYEGVELNFTIFPGEEVHFHGREHIVAFGGISGIGETYHDEYIKSNEYQKERENFKRVLEQKETLPDEAFREEYVNWRFALDKIHQHDGIAILCHPFWITRQFDYHNANEFFTFLCKNKCFDALELMNGENGDTNALQIAWWQQNQREGDFIPVVSGTDAHTTLYNPYFPKFFTVVYTAEALSVYSIKSALKENRTVVVNGLTQNNLDPMVYGEFRLIKFTLYLLRQVFPLHDELCFEEGVLMRRHLAGDEEARKQLQLLKGRINKLYDRLWG